MITQELEVEIKKWGEWWQGLQLRSVLNLRSPLSLIRLPFKGR